MSGGKNSIFRKPMGTGKGSAAQMIGMERPELEEAELSAEDKAREASFIQNLESDINGNENSMAVAQYKQAQDDATKNSMALNSSMKGVSNPALLARNVSQASDNQQQELAQDSGIMKIQERKDSLNSMNNYLAMKNGVAQNNANQQNANNQATMNRQTQILGAAGSGIATVAASDKNLKKDIEPTKGDASKKIDEFLNSLDSYNFEYKNEKHGKGEHTGIMAQDLEKSEMGSQMVEDTPEGKMVDFGQGFAVLLAAQAELKEQIDKMKKGK